MMVNLSIKPRANGRNIVGQQLPILLDVTCCFRLHTLLHVVGCCCVLLRRVWNRSNVSANNSQHFFCSVIAEAYGNNVGSVFTALPTLLGPRTLITHGLQRLMGCTLPTMDCRSQHCWELLHPFAHHCQLARNNRQHCWRNNIGSFCVCLHTTANSHATTLNIVDATMLGVVASVSTPLPTRTQQLPTLLTQQCWELLHPFAHHCRLARNNSQHCWRNNFGSCCVCLHAVDAAMLGVVASVCTQLTQQCWELLRLFARNLRCKTYLQQL